MRLRPRQLSLRGGSGESGRGLARRGGAGGRGGGIHEQQTALAPRPLHRIRDVVVSRGVGAVAALLVQGALAVLMIGPALDAHVSAGDASLEYAPVETVAGRRHIDRSIEIGIDQSRFLI